MNDVQLKTDADVRAAYLSAAELKLAASLIFQAYHDDPVFMAIFDTGSGDYEQKLRGAIREELAAFWQAQQPILGLYSGEALVGVACLHCPDSGFSSERFWHWRLKMMLSAGYVSTKQMIEKENKLIDAVPFKRFHILSFIAIHPLHQHHGFGHYLMAAVNATFADDAESEGVVVYVTTQKYQSFFDECDYQTLTQISVGEVTGPVMVHYRGE
ncbi:GNAT family N-acetyltransferase [Thalassotalea ponticola]|uniref:GNAT family N-acetyltransferase n=1 Tax=Thalassotalea ponticola TaxID=1523392 RepID=UPI0025B53ED0|nr:GNAT family N-acetyltransferase [Thalassotalea ponticola]MDN3652598.1 GNAT family N-acetyltransferase [Thalassotalea ponticola]